MHGAWDEYQARERGRRNTVETKTQQQTILIACTDRIVDAIHQLTEELHELRKTHDLLPDRIEYLQGAIERLP